MSAEPTTPDNPAPLRWDEDRPRFRPAEYAVTGIVGIAAIAEYIWAPPQREPHWVGGILFDDAVRDGVRLRSASGLRKASTLADLTGVTSTVLVVGVDSIIVPVARGSIDVAWQLAWIDFESYAFGSVVAISLYDTVGRARPSYLDCKHDRTDPNCNISPTASFPSGHGAEAFISAGLSCANHGHVPIYGSPVADAFACGRDLALATTDGLLRLMGDRHYATDVLAGAAIGFGFGYGLPVLLHYTSGGKDRSVGLVMAPMSVADGTGVVATGTF
jgi:membrane-associated phospholipid phosphatase